MRRSSSQTTLAQTRNVERLVALHAVGADQKDKLSQSRVARAVAQSLAFHRFAATNEATVEAQLDRIALKWELFGRADKAKALRMLAAHALANPVDELSLNRNAMHQAIAFLLFMENSAVMSPSSNPSPKMQLRNTSSASSKSASPKPASQSRFLEWKKANAPTSSQSAAKKRADAEDETTRESLAFAESLALRRRDASATGEYARTEWKAILDAEPLEGDHWDPVNYFSDDDETFSCEEDEEKIVHEDAHERSRGSRSGSQGPKSQDAESFSGRIGQLKGSMGPLDTAGDQTVVEDDAFLADYPVEKESQSPEMTELLNTHYWTPGRQIHGTDVSDFQFDMNEPNTLAPSIAQHQKQDDNFFGTPATTTNYVTETDVVREVLFLLSGLGGEMFELDADELYKPNMIACLRHLTVEMLESILMKFCVFADAIRRLELFVHSPNYESKQPQRDFEACRDAFGSIVQDALAVNHHWISELQTRYSNLHGDLKEGGESEMASLLVLLSTCSTKFAPLIELDTILNCATKKEADSSLEPVSLVNSICESAIQAQASCDGPAFQRATCWLVEILRPWFRAVETWWLDGTVSHALGIECNQAVPTRSAEFWASKYVHDPASTPSIMVEATPTIVSIGKCLIILRELNPELLVPLLHDLRAGLLTSILKQFLTLMAWQSCERSCEKQQVVPAHGNAKLVPPSEESAQGSLLLVQKSWLPDHTQEDILTLLPGLTDLVEDVAYVPMAKLDQLDVLLSSTLTVDIDERQMWRPVQLNLERAMEKVLSPKFESVGSLVTAQLVGPRCNLLRHLRTLQSVFLMTCGVIMGPVSEGIAEKMKSGEFYYRPGVVQAVFDASVASFDTGDENATEEWIEEADSIVLTIDDTLSGDTKRKWREKDGGDCRVTVKALECLKIGYETSWPVNCLITDKSLYLYNRALVFLMQLSLARNALAKETLSFDKSCNGSNFGWKRQRNGLRRRMQVFCEGMVAFSMSVVILPSVREFMDNISRYYDLDKLNEHHLQFLIDICSHFFLLNEKAFVILRAIRKCLDMCLKFAETCARFDKVVALIRSGRYNISASPLPGDDNDVKDRASTPSVTPNPTHSPKFSKKSHLSSHSSASLRQSATAVSALDNMAKPTSPQGSSRPSSRLHGGPATKVSGLTSSSSSSLSSRARAGSWASVSSAGSLAPFPNIIKRFISSPEIEQQIQAEGVRFGAEVEQLYGPFLEVHAFIVENATALASHGLPKLASLAVYIK